MNHSANSIRSLSHQSLKGEARHNKLVEQAQKWVGQTFYGTLMKQMHNSPFKSKILDGGRGQQAFQPLMDQQLVDRMSRKSAKGLVRSIVKKIEKKNGLGEDQATEAGKTPHFKAAAIANPEMARDVAGAKADDILATAQSMLSGKSKMSPLLSGYQRPDVKISTGAAGVAGAAGARTGLSPMPGRVNDFRTSAYRSASKETVQKHSEQNQLPPDHSVREVPVQNQGVSEKNPNSNVRFHVPAGLRA